MSRQFWISSGHHLLDHDENGYLLPTTDFWRVYLARPEIVPPSDACLVERALYDRLRRDPFADVPADEMGHIADRDARENWRHFLAFRDHVTKSGTIEAALMHVAKRSFPTVTLPPLFVNQMVHLIARNMLDDEADPFVLRAAEMLFRPQRQTIRDGVLLVADEEQIDLGVPVVDHASPLTQFFEEARASELEILSDANAATYWKRSDAFDLVMDFRHGKHARTALAKALERWTLHMLGHVVKIEPIERIEGTWKWYVGLDADATRIANDLWDSEVPREAVGLDRIVALFRLVFADPAVMIDRVSGEPVYLVLATSTTGTIRLKPQNLLVNLPLKRLQWLGGPHG